MTSDYTSSDSIGGYLPLEIPKDLSNIHGKLKKYQSARAALHHLLSSLPNFDQIWIPAYICDSIIEAAIKSKKKVVFYNINDNFEIANRLNLKENDLLLAVDYFGISHKNILNTLKKYKKNQIIVDCSQSFYSNPFDCLATIYSPRKFFGVPDGGLMHTNIELPPLEIEDRNSINRMQHLIERIAFNAETGYLKYKESEKSLMDIDPKKMSRLTKTLLDSIEYEKILNKRIFNYNFLQENLGKINLINTEYSPKSPLCYPLLTTNKNLKDYLRSKKIYIPTYWKEVLNRTESSKLEKNLTNNLLAIPCHQGIEIDQLSKIIQQINLCI